MAEGTQQGRVVCVVGTTASGKTDLAVLLAQALGGEVVSADSMQIYRGMEILSAAPTPDQTGGIPHHMLGVADPAESWSAARYALSAAPVVDDILARGKVPILAGGTGLWLDALIQGAAFAPRDGAVRRELERRYQTEGPGPLLDDLRAVDPAAAARLHPSDKKRILRALEVWRETGRTITEQSRENAARPPRYRAAWIGLCYRNRADLWDAVDRRVDAMLAAGLLDEVRALRSLPPESTALQAIGCKELLPVLDGQADLAEAVQAVKLHTRQYAKRQRTWFRRNPAVHWITWEETRDFRRALQDSTEYLRGLGVC